MRAQVADVCDVSDKLPVKRVRLDQLTVPGSVWELMCSECQAQLPSWACMERSCERSSSKTGVL